MNLLIGHLLPEANEKLEVIGASLADGSRLDPGTQQVVQEAKALSKL